MQFSDTQHKNLFVWRHRFKLNICIRNSLFCWTMQKMHIGLHSYSWLPQFNFYCFKPKLLYINSGTWCSKCLGFLISLLDFKKTFFYFYKMSFLLKYLKGVSDVIDHWYWYDQIVIFTPLGLKEMGNWKLWFKLSWLLDLSDFKSQNENVTFC